MNHCHQEGSISPEYPLNQIKARLQGTSESWIATNMLALNLVKLPGVVLLRPYLNVVECFSAWGVSELIKRLE